MLNSASGNNWQNWNDNSIFSPEMKITNGINNRFDDINPASLQIPLNDTGAVNIYSGQVRANAFDSEAYPISFSGTAGRATCSQSMQGTLKIATCNLSTYQETGTAQIFTFQTSFTTAPVILEQASGTATGGAVGSCGSYHARASESILTLPANPAMIPETCSVVAIGQ
jgi:hypothetical protein